MVASIQYNAQHEQELKLEAITDEFCPLVKTQDTMAKLDGEIEGMDDTFKVQEEDVNILARQEQQQEQKQQKQQKKPAKAKAPAAEGETPAAKKRTSSGSNTKKGATGGGANKKQRISLGRSKSK